MHQPRPYGLAVYGGELSERDGATIDVLARRLTNRKHLSEGVGGGLRNVRQLPDGGYVVMQDMGGVFRAIVHKPQEPLWQPAVTDGTAREYIPMLFSGSVTRHQLRDGEGCGLRLTEKARHRLTGYQKDDWGNTALAPEYVQLQRFRVEYADKFRYFLPDNPGIFTFTQWGKLRPGWYSSAMAAVVQVACGYGRQDIEQLPEDPWERATWKLPDLVRQKVKLQLGNTRLPGYAGVPPVDGKITFDYSARKSEALAFSGSGQPWLVRVDASGVYVMPLPVVPATATQAFREYIEDVGDTEVLDLLETFGAMPSGEGFPQAHDDFQAWIRAGVIIRVCDCEEFYRYQPIYDACGWSWNSNGTQAFNTCFEHDEDTHLLRVHAFSISLSLGDAEHNGHLPESWHIKDNDWRSETLNWYLSQLYRALTNDAKGHAIKYKLRRHDAQKVLDRARELRLSPGQDIQQEIKYWDDLKDQPIAQHSGWVRRVSSGPVYSPGVVPPGNGRLKFPTLDAQGCASFMLLSEEYKGAPVNCDTIVFGAYVGNELRVVKYFYEDRKFFKEEESTFEDLMIVGSWEKTTTNGMSGIAGNFYTTDFDARDELAPSVMHTTIVGRDLGYGEPAYKTPGIMFCVGSVTRSRYYEHKTQVQTKDSQGLDIAICIPVFCREAILHAQTQSDGGSSLQIHTERRAINDPTSYQLWTYDSIYHWIGQTNSGNVGDPRPKTGNPVYVDTMIYAPDERSDFADSGNWLNFPEGSFLDVTGIVGSYLDRSQTKHAGGVVVGGQAPAWESYSFEEKKPNTTTGGVSVCIPRAGVRELKNGLPHNWFFYWSPVESGGTISYFYREVTYNAFGTASFASTNEMDEEKRRIAFGYSKQAMPQKTAIFIGVINE